MRRLLVLCFGSAFIFAWYPGNASVISNGSFTFDYGGATPTVAPDPGFFPPWGKASIFSMPPPSTDSQSIFLPPLEDYNGSFGGSSYSVQPDFDTAGIVWDLEAQSTTPGGRRSSNYSLNPLVTLSGDTLNFSITYDVDAAGDSSFDFTVAQVQVLIGYGTRIFGPDWVPVIDEFSPPAVEFRGFDTSVVDETGVRAYGDLTKPVDSPNWIIRMQIIATASDFLPEDSPPPAVPEPSTLLLMGLGLAGLGFVRQRRGNA